MSGYEVEVVKINSCRSAEYIGRQAFGRKASPLCNTHRITTTISREEAILAYETDFYKAITDNNQKIIQELLRLHEVGKKNGVLKLGCFCSPLKCHGDIIARFLMDNYELLEELKLTFKG